MQVRLTDVSVKFVDQVEEDGVVAWVSCVLGEGLYLNNIAVRRRNDGRHILSFPAKKNCGNGLYFYFRPVTKEMHDAFERAILKNLGLRHSSISNN
ncbi:MAG TPA: hypothetical protein PKH33_05985 [bacterium]|nr:hypothetical protein [bacterium]